ncbi:DUF418 domain-containing protein [Actinacidiphila glaucinigra]|uniref:DUF418 domain-containing protein n=1 Tax=Actinacidiphila glaucinigra TaxID=235986 RepID=UPI003249C2FA
MTNVTPGAPRAAARAVGQGPSTGRLVGLDLARGLAVLGMYASHVGPDPPGGGPVGWAAEMSRGRSSALFALLAGFTLVILTGRPEPRTGRAGRQAAGRVLIRSAALVALGGALTALDTSVNVILAYYGLALALALPLRRLRAARDLALVALAGALVLPQVLYPLRAAAYGGGWADTLADHDPLARISGGEGLLDLLVTGDYPVLTWLPFIVAGMAVARLDLGRPGARARSAVWGAALAAAGYGGSWLALHLVPGALGAVSAATDGGPAAAAWWSDAAGSPGDTNPAWLLVAAPHSQTTFSILGNTGVALLVLAGCLAVVDRSAGLRRLAAPVAAVGSVSLTAYAGHIVALSALGLDDEDRSYTGAVTLWLCFTGTAVLAALLWTRVFRRGPLEYALHSATLPARLIN